MPAPVETTEIAMFSALRKMDLFDDLCDHVLVPMAKRQSDWWFKPSQSYLLARGYTLSGNARRGFQYWYQANWRELAKRIGVAPANPGAGNDHTAMIEEGTAGKTETALDHTTSMVHKLPGLPIVNAQECDDNVARLVLSHKRRFREEVIPLEPAGGVYRIVQRQNPGDA